MFNPLIEESLATHEMGVLRISIVKVPLTPTAKAFR